MLGAGCFAASLPLLSSCGTGSSRRRGPVRDVDVVMTQGITGLEMHEVARAQGYFDQFGINPRNLVVSDGNKCVVTLLSGAAKICIFSGFNQVTPAIEKGAKIKILAGALNVASLCMYSANPRIKTVPDLAGKSVGIGAIGSVLHQMTVLLLRKQGVDPGSVTFRNIGSNADVFKAVVSKTVDAGLSDVDVYDQQEEYGVHALPDGKLWEKIPEYTNQATYATDDAVRQDRDLLVRVLAAYGKAYRFVSSPASQDAWVSARRKVTSSNASEQAVTQWRWIQSSQPYAKDLVLSDERINLVQKLNIEFKNQSRMLPVAEVADMSLARDAVKLLEQ